MYVNESQYVGKVEEFMKWALLKYRYQDFTKILIYKKRAELVLKRAINETPGRAYVFMDIRIGEDGAAP